MFCKLRQNNESSIYPYHMPGHKRRPWGELPQELYASDITEIDGFDNLHQPEEILKTVQCEAAHIYGADETFYLVNGSTCGILSAISAAVPEGGHILMARNCHKSAYHAIYLRHLKVSYLYPTYINEFDICDAITPGQVADALEREPDVRAVCIVSPTYEGRIADIRAIAEVVHMKGIPLIVDEAHGAHLGFCNGLAPNSCQCGADLVVHSVHKTLPALTQTALLHVNGKLVDCDRVRRFLRIYQSSSPSYLLMAGIDNALDYVSRYGERPFREFVQRFQELLQELSNCRHLKFLQGDYRNQDVGKLIISVKSTPLSGKEIYDILLNKYGLQLEMASNSYALAMFTVNDGEEAYTRMRDALLEIDERLGNEKQSWKDFFENFERAEGRATEKISAGDILVKCMKQTGTAPVVHALPLYVGWDENAEELSLEDAHGRLAAEFINLYPPGVPILVPGERITREICAEIVRAKNAGLNVQGTCAVK